MTNSPETILPPSTPSESDELIVLRQRVAELEAAQCRHEQTVRELRDQISALTEREGFLARLVAVLEATPDFVGIAHQGGVALYINSAGRRMTGLGADEDISERLMRSLHPAWARQIIEDEGVAALRREGVWRGETALLARDGREIPVSQVLTAHAAPDGTLEYVSTIARDISEHKRAEAERLRLQDELIRVQSETLRQLSTPLIPISDTITVLPLIGSVDANRAQQVLETLLSGVAQHRSRVVILDITGVPVVDAQVANALIRAAQAVQLLGAEIILTGLRPEVAQTLVGLGVDLSRISTRSTLQSGIAAARGRGQTLSL